MHKFTIHQLMSRNCMKILGTLSRRLDEHTVQALSVASWRGRFILQIGLLPNCSGEYLKETHTAWGQSQSTPSAFVPPLAFVWQREEHDPSIFSFNLPVSYITKKGIDEMLIVASKMQNSHSCTASQCLIERNRVLLA